MEEKIKWDERNRILKLIDKDIKTLNFTLRIKPTDGEAIFCLKVLEELRKGVLEEKEE